MEHLQIILPSVLLIIGFLLKLLIGRQYDLPTTIRAGCEFPVDIVLLALSFTVAYTITRVENHSNGLSYCFVGIAIVILVVFLWRLSTDLFLSGNWLWILILLFNLFISGVSIMKSVTLVINTEKEEAKKKIEVMDKSPITIKTEAND